MSSLASCSGSWPRFSYGRRGVGGAACRARKTGGGAACLTSETGGGGGGGGGAIKYFRGMTPGNTLSVNIGAGGAGGVGTYSTGGAGTNGVVTIEY